MSEHTKKMFPHCLEVFVCSMGGFLQRHDLAIHVALDGMKHKKEGGGEDVRKDASPLLPVPCHVEGTAIRRTKQAGKQSKPT